MLKNYLKISYRNLTKYKGYTFLNVFGLAIGIAVVALIMLYVKFEWGYDRFYPQADRIYRVIQKQPGNFFLGTDYYAVTQQPLGKTMQEEFPEVTNYSTLSIWPKRNIEVNREKRFEENILYATAPNFFTMFSYRFIKGNPKIALSQLNTVVLSEEVANKFFGTKNPVGQVINVDGKYLWTVNGVFKPLPKNSQFAACGIITSFNTYASTLKDRKDRFDWSNSSWYTYVMLKRGTNINSLQAKFPELVNKYLSESDKAWGLKKHTEFFLQPLTEIHLFNKANFGMGKSGSITGILILIALAFIILAIACINYTNLATARTSLRSKEVGVRKVIGAKKGQLIAQFLGESVILSTSAGILGLVLDEIFLSSFSNLVGISFNSISLLQSSFIVSFILLVALVGLLSGFYPAFLLSASRPVRVLKGGEAKSSRSILRNILVAGQFAASIILITCTLIILSQMNYIKTKNLGYNRENVVVLKLNDKSIKGHINLIEQRLKKYSSVVNVTACTHLPINVTSETHIHISKVTSNNGLQAYQLYTDYNFLKTFNIPIVQGRDFSPAIPTDTSDAVIINQSLENSLGLKSAVGKTLMRNDHTYKIIGVMKDFNLHSLHYNIQPLFVALKGPIARFLCIRIRPGNISQSIKQIKSVWNEFATQSPFNYTFLDNDFKAMYGNEERLSEVVAYSSGLAIIIACMGLFGLIAFIVDQRRKEVGIRKVLGASVTSIMRLMSMRFIRLVLIADVIAWPFAYYLMNKWLDGFAYKINIGFGPFIIAGVITLFIAIATVSTQAIKAAIANPVKSIRYE